MSGTQTTYNDKVVRQFAVMTVIWGIVDAVLILTDKVRDPQGRPLRDGT